MKTLFNSEPVAILTGLPALVGAIVGFTQVMHWTHMTSDQVAAFTTMIGALGAFGAAIARSKVSPTS